MNLKRMLLATAALLAALLLCGVVFLLFSTMRASATSKVLGPYLAWLDGTSTEIMLWTKDRREVNLVMTSGGPSGAELGKTTWYGVGEHRFSIAGLTPGTAYTYRLQGDGATGTFTFKTAPAERTDFTFIAYGDSRDAESPHRHHALAINFASHNPEFVISTGDQLQDVPKEDGDIFSKDWVNNVFTPVPRDFFGSIPIFRTLGNHDVESEAKESAFFKAFPKTKEYMYEFAWGGSQFICLYMPESVLGFKEKQRQWFKEKVASRPDARWRIVYFHVPPWAGGKHGKNPLAYGGREQLLADLVEAKVDLVFNGHEHAYQRTRPMAREGASGNPVVFVVTGIAGATPYEIEPQPFQTKVVTKTDHYCVIELDAETLRLTALDNKEQPIDRFEIKKDADGHNSFSDDPFLVK